MPQGDLKVKFIFSNYGGKSNIISINIATPVKIICLKLLFDLVFE